ncbi:MAG: pyridoxamine 5'-phosphate oxidase family protein [Nocardioidaceae bacterium]
MRHEDVQQVLNKPIAQNLLRSAHLARVAYTGIDGFPRVVPVGFYWDGACLIVCTVPNAPKVPALTARPKVALTIDTDTQPPRVLLVRGATTIEVVDGVPTEYLEANKKVGEPQQWQAFETQVRALYDQMARISIEPEWAKLLDFETTFPSAVEEIVRRKHPELLPGADNPTH